MKLVSVFAILAAICFSSSTSAQEPDLFVGHGGDRVAVGCFPVVVRKTDLGTPKKDMCYEVRQALRKSGFTLRYIGVPLDWEKIGQNAGSATCFISLLRTEHLTPFMYCKSGDQKRADDLRARILILVQTALKNTRQ